MTWRKMRGSNWRERGWKEFDVITAHHCYRGIHFCIVLCSSTIGLILTEDSWKPVHDKCEVDEA